jgi:hypothetical protein
VVLGLRRLSAAVVDLAMLAMMTFKRVWTALDGDNGRLFGVPSYRLAYALTVF